jgi:hypothetical protein
MFAPRREPGSTPGTGNIFFAVLLDIGVASDGVGVLGGGG